LLKPLESSDDRARERRKEKKIRKVTFYIWLRKVRTKPILSDNLVVNLYLVGSFIKMLKTIYIDYHIQQVIIDLLIERPIGNLTVIWLICRTKLFRKKCLTLLKAIFHFNRIVLKRSVFLCFLSTRVELYNDLDTKENATNVTMQLKWKTTFIVLCSSDAKSYCWK
jgi:hypothetical protein